MTARRPARYMVTPGDSDNRCFLTLFGAYAEEADWRAEEVLELEFWRDRRTGYVFQVTPERPGVLGRQVCAQLFGYGSTLTVSSEERLLREIRLRARRFCDRIDHGGDIR